MATILSWSSGDVDDYKVGKIWDIKVENPSKMKSAFDELTKKIKIY